MRALTLALTSFTVAASFAEAQPRQRTRTQGAPVDTTQRLEIYGFGQGDGIYDFRSNDPLWFDVNRPTKLPAFHDEFGDNYRNHFSARQSRFGVKGVKPSDKGDVTAHFEFDMFGVGIDAGQTTIRLRLAYGQWGPIGGGQLPSPFMDVDVFPNILDYWGPNGMLFFRNVMFFWEPYNNDNTRVTFALERPGASADAGVVADRIELQNIRGRFPAPDVSAEYRLKRKWGYVELAGIVRTIRWDDILPDTFDLAGGTTGWGVSLSSNIKPSKRDVIRLQAVYGEGVENYFNDAPVDIGVKFNPGNRFRPIIGVALPDLGLIAYLDHTWNSKWTSAIGWSMVQIENSDAQAPTAFRRGHYASLNLLATPVPNVMMGGELQYGSRRNFSDGFSSDDFRIQVSFKYSFSKKFGGT